jgi:hypothetical protein
MRAKSPKTERHTQYIQSIRIAAALLDGPLTYEEILNRYYGYLRFLGLFKLTEWLVHERKASVSERLEKLLERGWIVHEGDTYALTSRAHVRVIRANVPLAEMCNYATISRSLTQGRASYTMEPSYYTEVPSHIAEKIITGFTPTGSRR